MKLPLLLLALSAGTIGASSPMTIEDYATITSFGSPRISPDGQHVAWTQIDPDLEKSVSQNDVWITALPAGTPRRVTETEKEESHLRWRPDGRALAFLSERDGPSQIFLLTIDGGGVTKLTNAGTGIADFQWSPDGRSIAFTTRDALAPEVEARRAARDDANVSGENPRHRHIHLLNVESSQVTRLTSGKFSVLEFDFSPDGRTIVFSRAPGLTLSDRYDSDIALLALDTFAVTPLVTWTGTDTDPQFSPDGRTVAFLTNDGVFDWAAELHIGVIPATGGKPRVVSRSYNRSVESYEWSADGRSLFLNGPWGTTGQLFRLDLADGSLHDLSRVEGFVSDATFNPRVNLAAFVFQSLTAPAEVYVSPLDRFAPRRLSASNERLRSRTLAETRLIRWRNPKDGLEIEGLLTLPIGYEKGKRVPLITFVHGGPSSFFYQGFSGYLGHLYPAQVFASRGYAMLKPNPRGSGGYGERFRQANRSDWGGRDWQDIVAGIDHLVDAGIADPKRLGLTGWSYGGYMTSWAITQTDRFRAVSIGAPVTDFFSFDGNSDIPGYLGSFFGGASLQRDAALFRSRNPITHMARAKTPALIQHGENDQRVPTLQSRMLYRALKDLGVPAVLVTYPRQGHGIREPKLRVDVGRRNVWWFEKWINGDERSFEEYWGLRAETAAPAE